MLRDLASRLSRALLWMSVGAVIVVGAQLYGPTLVAGVLPDALRPAGHSEPPRMNPAAIMDALDEIRGALE